MLEAFIPYGGYFCTPFAKWQGSLAHLHSLKLAAHVVRRALESRRWDPTMFDLGVLGMTVPQRGSFYGVPWLMGMVGAAHVGGPTIAQACATSVRCLSTAAQEIAAGASSCVLVVATDRTSNGPHIYYPDPRGTGGTGEHEDWVLDNFNHDPHARLAMIATAENVARRHGISTVEQHEVVLRRYEQYQRALADGSAFLRRFMELPFPVPDGKLQRTVAELGGDEGVFATTRAGLDKLKPVLPGGTVTFGGQTHPADGAAGAVVTTRARARELAADAAVSVRLAGFGQARTEAGHMPEATVPAARAALTQAGIAPGQLAAVKSHNPFAVNDVFFAREMGLDVMAMNDYGSSLVWGHPQAPTGLRGVIELVEELAVRGGGYGLFQGCAAGDTAMAVVVEVR